MYFQNRAKRTGSALDPGPDEVSTATATPRCDPEDRRLRDAEDTKIRLRRVRVQANAFISV
jgi:hypothetical protein